jgi:hypothetical protein
MLAAAGAAAACEGLEAGSLGAVVMDRAAMDEAVMVAAVMDEAACAMPTAVARVPVGLATVAPADGGAELTVAVTAGECRPDRAVADVTATGA